MKKTQTKLYSNHSKNKKPTRGLKTNQKAELAAHRPLIIRNCFLDQEQPAPGCHPCSDEACDQGAKATRLGSRRTFLFLAEKGPRQHTETLHCGHFMKAAPWKPAAWKMYSVFSKHGSRHPSPSLRFSFKHKRKVRCEHRLIALS